MKELKDIVHDLEYAKKLKELGVKQDSIFYLFRHIVDEDIRKNYMFCTDKQKGSLFKHYSAFTATELLEMLPDKILYSRTFKQYWSLAIIKNKDVFEVFYGSYQYRNKKLSNGLAKMLIYLIENKLMELK